MKLGWVGCIARRSREKGICFEDIWIFRQRSVRLLHRTRFCNFTSFLLDLLALVKIAISLPTGLAFACVADTRVRD